MKLTGLLYLFPSPLLAGFTNGSPQKAPTRIDANSQLGLRDVANNTFSTVTISDTASERYRNPGSICENTPSVNEVVGLVDLKNEADGNAISSYFFWFTEARQDANTVPLTIWLNGGPGSDSLLGLFGGKLTTEKNRRKLTDQRNYDRDRAMQSDGWSKHDTQSILVARGVKHPIPVPAGRRRILISVTERQWQHFTSN